ncbi:unnamed protein product [Ceutorhynchus assimilis]|uniref:Protein DEK n=1 Tax=Ceutorhynchus assimilis TaxID=467358 RepID=A0A9N9MJC6_9CUCU|nr:unnamed protein product [Ceutorhynchus assimilis]
MLDMSTEGDSVKSALSEANEKHATDNHTDDSSQDSEDIKEGEQVDKLAENNVDGEKNDKSKGESTEGTEGESDQESETSEKKEDVDGAKNEDDEKPEDKEKKSEGDKASDKTKKEEKDEKSEDDEGEQEDQKVESDKPAKDSKNAKDSKPKEEKASTASEKDEEEDEEDQEPEDEEDEASNKKDEKKSKKKGVPLLDQPLETSGKRERKNVQKFDEEDNKKEPQKIEFEEGAGTPLGEIPRVEASINRYKSDELKFLHKLLFKGQATKAMFKKNIRKFNGFSFEKDSDEYKKKIDVLKKSEVKVLKTTCEILDLQKTGNRDEISERVMEFLMEPKDSGKPVGGTGRPKRASAVRANNRGLIQTLSVGYSSHDDYSSDDKQASRSRRDKVGKRANLKEDSSSDEEFKPGDASDASDEKPRAVGKRKRGRPKKGSSEEEELASSLSGGSSDESDDAPKSKRRKSVTKNSKAKPKTPSRRGRPAKAAPPRSAAKRGRKPKNVSSEDEEEDEKMEEGSSSEDEPLVKKKAKASEPPTDDEIKDFIKSVLEGANLEEITMKTVCQRVYDNYPKFDLTARKNFIKSTVRSLIST